MTNVQENLEPKNLEVLGNNQVSSANTPKQIENLASPEMGNNAMTTTKDNDDPKAKRMVNKFANDELNLADLDEVLSKTIFEDTEAKRILFLASTLTFTKEHQKNIILTGASSVGKTYNIQEILWFFKDSQNKTIIAINDATPRSLIYSPTAVDVDERTLEPIDFTKAPKKGDAKELFDEWYDLQRHRAKYLKLSNKILVFYDIPNYQLLTSLRSLLSHDSRICTNLVTDKTQSGKNQTRKILIEGFFTAIFASANSTIDEQESSRTFMLSPCDSSEKIKKAIELQGKKLTDVNFANWYETEPTRQGLKKRIESIREAKIEMVLFKETDMTNLQEWFFQNTTNLGPRAQRDFPRLLSIAQAWALLNYQHRERTDGANSIYANSTDVEIAKTIYKPILVCNELGLTPEEYEVWKIIEPECKEDMGLRISEIHSIYYYAKQRHCPDKRLREMLKNFVTAGLLKEEKEGVTIKYYPIAHKETKQSELSNKGDGVSKSVNPFVNSDNQKQATGQ